MIPAQTILENTGIPLSVIMIQTLRGVCSVARIKFRKNDLDKRKTVDIATFVNMSKRGSKRFRLLMTAHTVSETPHNINKFARNMDIVINGSQSEFLNGLWTNNFFSNNMKTFLFKLHNNTLGYNNAVAHFVPNHSPGCTFCDSAGNREINIETGAHLFFECEFVGGVIDFIFDRVTSVNNFEFSRREYFATFCRREYSVSKNLALTYVSKIIMKVLWDCKLRFAVPNGPECWDLIKDEIIVLKGFNRKFSKLWTDSGLHL
jgi:hypothetical protein